MKNAQQGAEPNRYSAALQSARRTLPLGGNVEIFDVT